jgi:hypothetical protein
MTRPTGRPTVFDAEAAAKIIEARLVGVSLRRCVAAVSIPWTTFTTWLERGRKAVAARDAGEAITNPHDLTLADFAAKIDAADAKLETNLWTRVMDGTLKDPRLALDVLRWRAGKAEREAELGLIRAKREVEEKRAKGEHVDRHSVSAEVVVLPALESHGSPAAQGAVDAQSGSAD